MNRLKKLNFISPFNTTSYGYVGCNLLSSLAELYPDLEIAAQCIPHKSTFSAEDKFSQIKKQTDNFEGSFFSDAPSIKIWHQFDMTGFTGRGPKIGFPIFELNKFTDTEKRNLEYPDHLVVCSKWAKETVLNNIDRSPETIHVVPLGVDRSIFHDNYKNEESSVPAPTRFMNMGKWEVRKGHDIVIKAFNQAFPPDANVELHMFNDNPFLKPAKTKEWHDLYLKGPLSSKIHFGKRLLNQVAVYNNMKLMDCGVFPSRAEGWNLEILEMMSCGKHIITTDVTGHTEFCDQYNSSLIYPDCMETAFDGQFFYGQGEWYTIEDEHVDQIAEFMYYDIHIPKQENKLKQNKEGIKTAKQFTWEHSAKKLYDTLNSILEK